MFHLHSAVAHYKDEIVLKGITLEIQRGQKVALIGCSGSGKSTLLKLLYQQQPRNIALVPQHLGLVQSLSVFHNVYMGGLGRASIWANLINLVKPMQTPLDNVSKILSLVGLDAKIMQPVAQLSGGQQQRTAIARALMQGGEVLLADEPVSSLDEQQSEKILILMCQHFNTVILAMHDIDLALQCCDRIIGLRHGKITLDAPASELQHDDLLAQYGE